MKTLSRLTFAAFALALAITVGRAQFIDDFSADSSGDYNPVLTYNGGGNGNLTYALNSSDQFAPTGGGSSTTYFIRNTGEVLSDTTFGESVQIDIDGLGTGSAAGIGFSTTVDGSGSPALFELGVLTTDSSSDGEVDGFGSSFGFGTDPLDLNFSLGAIVVDVTRTGDTSFSFTLSGSGLTNGPYTGIFTVAGASGHALYFGPMAYTGASPDTQVLDNFAFTAPEPGTWMLMLAGAGVLALAVRFRPSAS